MNTITSYKVVYIDNYGDLNEKDFETEAEARNFVSVTNNSILYKVQILGSIERLL